MKVDPNNPPDDAWEFTQWADRLPPRHLVDMKAIMDGTFTPYDSFGRKLVEMFEGNFEKFSARYEKLQLAHDRKIEAMDAAEAARAKVAQPVAQVVSGEKDVGLPELVEWLKGYGVKR